MTGRESTGGTPLRSQRYQAWLVALLSLDFGVLFFDRQAASFMMPMIQPDLGLSNLQVRMIASGLSLAWALAALTVGPLSDRLGSRMPILLAATLMFCLLGAFGPGGPFSGR